MNKKILETLEFNKVKALFEPHLLTEQGLEQLRQLAPTAKADKIKQAFAEMKEMQALFRRATAFYHSCNQGNRRSLQAVRDGSGPQYRGVPPLEARTSCQQRTAKFLCQSGKCQLGRISPLV